MQLYCPILLASRYLCLYLSIIGGIVVAFEMMEQYWDFTGQVFGGRDRRDDAPSVFAKESDRVGCDAMGGGSVTGCHHYLGGKSSQRQP